MKKYLIKNGRIVNNGAITSSDILIEGELISKISTDIKIRDDYNVIDARGKIVIPGVIDDQVHFREPGLIHKATIASESKAAIAGGITSFIEMPNTNTLSPLDS